MIHESITEAFNSVKIEKGILSNETITMQIVRLESQYMDLLSDYISIPYSQRLYEELNKDFDDRIAEKQVLAKTVSKTERQHLEQIIESFKNSKWDAKGKMEDLIRKEESFAKRQGFFEEKIRLLKTLMTETI